MVCRYLSARAHRDSHASSAITMDTSKNLVQLYCLAVCILAVHRRLRPRDASQFGKASGAHSTWLDTYTNDSEARKVSVLHTRWPCVSHVTEYMGIQLILSQRVADKFITDQCLCPCYLPEWRNTLAQNLTFYAQGRRNVGAYHGRRRRKA